MLVRLVSAVPLEGIHALTMEAPFELQEIAGWVFRLQPSTTATFEFGTLVAVLMWLALLRWLTPILPWMIPLTVLPRLMVAALLMGLRLMLQPLLMMPAGIKEMLVA